MSERLVGTIKMVRAPKGYGFIGRESSEDIFIHFSRNQNGRVQTSQGRLAMSNLPLRGPKGNNADVGLGKLKLSHFH